MKKLFYTFIFSTAFTVSVMATTHTVSNIGNTYTPATLTIMIGDTVNFNLSNNHNVVEVSETTWNSNGTTALNGGVSLGFGGGQLIFNNVDTIFYVCTPHAGQGMKAKIIVQGSNLNTEANNFILSHLYAGTNQTIYLEGFNLESEALEYSVFDLTGKVVARGNSLTSGGQFSIAIPMTGSTGMFIVQLFNSKTRLTKKLILN